MSLPYSKSNTTPPPDSVQTSREYVAFAMAQYLLNVSEELPDTETRRYFLTLVNDCYLALSEGWDPRHIKGEENIRASGHPGGIPLF